MQMRKKLYIFKHFAKSKKLFLAKSINLHLIPIEIPKKYKIEAPYCTHTLTQTNTNTITHEHSVLEFESNLWELRNRVGIRLLKAGTTTLFLLGASPIDC